MMAELHLHGGRAVVNGALAAIAELGFCRLAEPGEFTRRAFEHDKLDLTAAEAIADLVAAETEQQRRLALQQMGGALHRLYEDWRTLGLARARPSRGGDRLPRRGSARGHRRRGEDRHRPAAGRDRGPSRRPARRAAARGPEHRHHRPAQCRQVLAAQPAGAARGGDRVGDRRHHARRDRGPSRSRRLAGRAGRHRGPARHSAMRSSRKACAAPGPAPTQPTCACWCSTPSDRLAGDDAGADRGERRAGTRRATSSSSTRSTSRRSRRWAS